MSAINSATGVASQIPFTPKKAGRTSIVTNINTKEREKARMAETTPFDNAVNIPLEKILNPIKNSAKVHIRFHVTARLYTGLSGRANTDTRGFVKAKEVITITTEIPPITFKLIVISFFSFSRFLSP